MSDVKTARINVEGNFIFGDTVENHETITRTLEFVKTHRDLLNNLNFAMIRLFPGSSLYEKAIAEGKIEPSEHIKKQCPPVNVSMLSDEEYAYYNNYYLNYFFVTQIEIDVNIKNITSSQITGTECMFRFECVSCEKKHEMKVSLENMAQPDCRFFCDCGEKLMLDFYHHLIDRDKIIQIIKNHKTAFYGIGRVFYKCFFKCELSELRDKFLLINSSERSTIAVGDNLATIFPPEAINEFNVEKVIVTLSGSYDVETIVDDLKKRFPCVDFVMWYVSDSTLIY